MINVSWARGTRDIYGAGLLVYHVFCDLHNIVEEDRSPASLILIIVFILSCAGSYAGGTLVNYVFAIHTWHILHGIAWSMEDMQVRAALTGAVILVPPTSKWTKRASVMVKLMEHIISALDHTDPLDTAITSCFLTIFYLVACTGEFMLPTLNTFDPMWHIKPLDISN